MEGDIHLQHACEDIGRFLLSQNLVEQFFGAGQHRTAVRVNRRDGKLPFVRIDQALQVCCWLANEEHASFTADQVHHLGLVPDSLERILDVEGTSAVSGGDFTHGVTDYCTRGDAAALQ